MAVFCFTDIEGSTEKWERYPDVMGQVIARHNQILEQAIAGFGGKLIKHTGDGVFVIFDGAMAKTDAPLRCAVEIQRQVQKENWPGIGELRIRMAFHSGEAEQMGGDYFGPVANRTARLLSLGWGGQVLVSEDMKKLGGLPPGATFADLGVHQVKDLPEPQQVYGLIHASLKLTHFPPLKSLSDRPHNLPAQLTPFVGREKELASIATFLATPNQRLLTVRGAGGMGKTRLCIQAGSDALKNFKNGVYFVALEALTAPEQIVAKVVESLRVTSYEKEDPTTQLLSYLRDKELLLILDNFDQLLADIGLLSLILQAAPKVKILASCRSRLNHGSETVLEIRGLDLELPSGGAVKIFLQRARMARPDFEVKPEDEDFFGRICQRLEGMPLALELAAAWVRAQTLKDICKRLDTSVALLVSAEKDLPERQRSLRALFEYSWKLLSADEQKTFQNLSVFLEGFSGEAARRVALADSKKLMDLTDKSLVRAEGEDRFSISEITRQFAQAKLDTLPGDKAKALDLHARYYLQLLKDQEAAIGGSGQARALKTLRQDLDNIKRAWKWGLERAWARPLSQAARCLALATELLGEGPQGRAMIEQALGLWGGSELKAFEGVSTEESIKGFASLVALVSQSHFDAGSASASETAKVLERSIQTFKRLQGKDAAAYWLVRLARLNPPTASACLSEAQALYRQLGDKNGEAWASAGLGRQLWATARDPQAKTILNQSLEVFKGLGNASEEARTLRILGGIALDEGSRAEGVALYLRAKERLSELGDQAGVAWVLLRLSERLCRERIWQDALPFALESLKLFETLAQGKGAQAALACASIVYGGLGDSSNALALLDRAMASASALADGDQKKAVILLQKVELLMQAGRLEEAFTLSGAVAQAMQAAKNTLGVIEAQEIQGDLYIKMGNPTKARELYKKANLDYGQLGAAARASKGWTFVKIAETESALNQAPDALKNYSRSLSLSEAPDLEDFALAALAGLAGVLVKEKKQLDALKLLLLCDRVIHSDKAQVSRPSAYAKLRQDCVQQLSELDSKLIQSTVEDTRLWAKTVALGPFVKEVVAKYRN